MAGLSIEDVVRGTQGALVAGDLGVPVTGVSIDSRHLAIGEAFFAIRGPNRDGHGFLRDAAARGAACLVVHNLPGRPAALGADDPGGRHHAGARAAGRVSPRRASRCRWPR